MKILYLDCGMGAAGDMLSAALLELMSDPDACVREFNELGIPHVSIERETVFRCGIQGTHLKVTVDGAEENEHMHIHEHEHIHEHDDARPHHDHDHSHEHGDEHLHHDHNHEHPHGHHHASMHEIEHIVRGHMHLADDVADDVMAVYQLIAEAESHAHGVPVSEIHFHEVGTMDAICDITMTCLLMKKLKPDEVVVSPVHVGAGSVKCAHGILPVPAPATAYILQDVPIYGGEIQSELCTPTGAALLKHFATRFGAMPLMKIEKTGYGCGTKEFPKANCVRAMYGESAEANQDEDTIVTLSCNIDDMTGEEIGFAMEQLLSQGAVDVYTIPIGMKKGRPGTMINILCRENQKEDMVRLIFQYTTTLGIRETISRRYILNRSVETRMTPYGPVRIKHAEGYGVSREKAEYEDLARIADETGQSLQKIKDLTS